MKGLAVFAVVAVVMAAAVTMPKVVDKEFMVGQKKVVELLAWADQPDIVFTEYYKMGETFDVDMTTQITEFKDAWMELQMRFKHGMLPRDAVFSPFYEEHLDEAKLLFHVFYYAKTFDDFVKVASWARRWMNVGMYDYAFRVAVVHREDTKFFHLPAPYTTHPHMFFDTKVMNQAYHYKMSYDMHTTTKATPFVIMAHHNVTEYPETRMSYYLNDVKLNDFFARVHVEYPLWMPAGEHGHKNLHRGAIFANVAKNLLARYYMERLSNNLGEVEYIDFDDMVMTGYYPMMTYETGMFFPHREPYTKVPHHLREFVTMFKQYETRIMAAIHSGFVKTKTGAMVGIYTPEGYEMICNMIMGTPDSVAENYYGNIIGYFKHILGFTPKPDDKYHVYPNAMEFYTTTLRDPAFYALSKTVMTYFMSYKEKLPYHTKHDLAFEGVSIESVAVDKLLTYFEWVDTDITEAVPVYDHKEIETMDIHARWMRLNHKPFTYHMTVKSDKDTKAVFRIFLGPKHTVTGKSLDIDENWMNFIELDYFVATLKAGSNKVERKSTESVFMVGDHFDYHDLLEEVTHSVKTDDKFNYKQIRTGFPEHLMLPKGKKEGMMYQLFVYVSNFEEEMPIVDIAPFYTWTLYDHKPIGFPLDRPMEAYNFTMPNMFFKDVVIYHKHDMEMNHMM